MITPSLRRAWKFFHKHAGYCIPPGRTVCAWHLAKAERAAKDAGCTWQWEPDYDADLSWMDAEERKKEHTCEGCLLFDPDGNVLTSLWGIVDADDDYRRVIEAD